MLNPEYLSSYYKYAGKAVEDIRTRTKTHIGESTRWLSSKGARFSAQHVMLVEKMNDIEWYAMKLAQLCDEYSKLADALCIGNQFAGALSSSADEAFENAHGRNLDKFIACQKEFKLDE